MLHVRTKVFACLVAATAILAGGSVGPLRAEPALSPEQESGAVTSDEAPTAAPAPAATPAPDAAAASPTAPLDEMQTALKDKLQALPSSSDEQTGKELAALVAFYQARNYKPLWTDGAAAATAAKDLVTAFKDANAYGLEASDFIVPSLEAADTLDKRTALEIALTRTALLYARHARGGRIMKPSEQLNSNLDRKPQLLDPKAVLDGLAASATPATYLAGTHPKHAQFEKLRQAFLDAGGAKAGAAIEGGKSVLSTQAKRLRANMEMWRWMYDDMGALYVFNNIPEFMQYVYKDGVVIRKEKIVAGMVDKQSSIFSRPLKYVVLRPKWRVPESIMVHELWPSLIRGGGYMRQYGLQLETKDGRPLDWRTIDWTKDDIRNYHVTQPPGPRSVLGNVKFTFPSQHTIFMHDTPDKWMFRSAQRTHSHGCLRVWKPMELAEIVLGYDKGWDKAKVAELSRSGPLNNEVALDKRVMINLVYFTMWVEDGGKLRSFADIYGHERRIIQALDGQWEKINKGRDHLAKPQPNFNPKAVASSPGSAAAQAKRRAAKQTTGDLLSDMFGGLSF